MFAPPNAYVTIPLCSKKKQRNHRNQFYRVGNHFIYLDFVIWNPLIILCRILYIDMLWLVRRRTWLVTPCTLTVPERNRVLPPTSWLIYLVKAAPFRRALIVFVRETCDEEKTPKSGMWKAPISFSGYPTTHRKTDSRRSGSGTHTVHNTI